MNIILLGPPGVGKGTYAEILKEKLELPHISTGDILREMAKEETEEGKNIKEIMDKGNLIPDELITEILKKRLKKEDCKNGFILDGYPRTIPQAESLKKIIKMDKVIDYAAKDEIILQRLGGRLTCRSCGAIFHAKNSPPKKNGICDNCGGELYTREDQTDEAIKERLKVYRNQTEPLIEYYQKEELLIEIDANAGLDQVDKIVGESLDAIEGEE